MTRAIITELIADPNKFSSGVKKAETSATGFGSTMDKVGLKTKGVGGVFDKLGTSFGGLVSPTSLAAGGALALVGVLGESFNAADKVDVVTNRLGASLKANVSGWAGNVDEVVKATRVNEKYGFSQDDLIASMATLVGATHSVSKALDVQKVAMDLARYKGISLGDATDALTKIEGGSYRILKSLGIVTTDVKTQTEALAAVEGVAAGQAQAYGDSTAGAMDRMKEHAHDLEVQFGSVVETVFVGWEKIGGAVDDATKSYKELQNRTSEFQWGKVIGQMHGWSGAVDEAASQERNAARWADGAPTALAPSVQRAGDAAKYAYHQFDILDTVLGDFYSLTSLKGKEASLSNQLDKDSAGLRALTAALKDGKISLAEQKDLQAKYGISVDIGNVSIKERNRLLDIQKGLVADDSDQVLKNAEAMAKLGNSKALDDWFVKQQKNWDKLTLAEKQALVAAENAVNYNVDRGNGTPGKGGKKNASGALFNTGGATDITVGEAGQETVAILRNPRQMSSWGGGGGGGGGGHTINIHGDVYGIDNLNDKIAAGLRMAGATV